MNQYEYHKNMLDETLDALAKIQKEKSRIPSEDIETAKIFVQVVIAKTLIDIAENINNAK